MEKQQNLREIYQTRVISDQEIKKNRQEIGLKIRKLLENCGQLTSVC